MCFFTLAAPFLKELEFHRVEPTDIAMHTGAYVNVGLLMTKGINTAIHSETFFMDVDEYYAAPVDPVVKGMLGALSLFLSLSLSLPTPCISLFCR